MSRERRMEGSAVLVTGVASGIGAACAERLAEEGAMVAGLDLHAPDPARWSRVEARAADASFAVADVADEASVRDAIAAAVARFGHLDGLAHCAGVSGVGRAHELDAGDWDRVVDVNLKGSFLVVKHVLRQMVTQRSGSIVLTASIEGLEAGNRVPAYDASKGGVVLLTKNLAVDYGEYGIRVNCICPGFIRTGMTAKFEEPQARPMRERMERLHMLGRFGEPAEVAAAVYFLLSADASFVTGHALLVDGGFLCGHRMDIPSLTS